MLDNVVFIGISIVSVSARALSNEASETLFVSALNVARLIFSAKMSLFVKEKKDLLVFGIGGGGKEMIKKL